MDKIKMKFEYKDGDVSAYIQQADGTMAFRGTYAFPAYERALFLLLLRAAASAPAVKDVIDVAIVDVVEKIKEN